MRPAAVSNLIVRGGFLVLVAVHAFFCYSTARVFCGNVGFQLTAVVSGLAFAAAMILPLVWMFGLVDLPRWFYSFHRPAKRWKRGQCPTCGYDMRAAIDNICSECGNVARQPDAYRFSATVAAQAMLLATVSWMTGSLVAEGAILYDERAFIDWAVDQPASAFDKTKTVHRPRIWPNQHVSLYLTVEGHSLSTEWWQ